MRAMRWLIVLLPAVCLAIAACGSSETEKQWYKPNQDYTKADFDRDSKDCTDKKSKTLDGTCMQQRGWATLGGDIEPAAKDDPTRGAKNKNKYK